MLRDTKFVTKLSRSVKLLRDTTPVTKRHICHETSLFVTKRRVFSRNVTFCHETSHFVYETPYLITKRNVLSRNVIFCHKTSHFVTKRHILSRNVTFCHETSHFVTKRHHLSRNVMFCHETSLFVLKMTTTCFFVTFHRWWTTFSRAPTT